ncbi:hypothetical protein F4054_09810 [Candidatus Poribacteria bacterium]|nr:hypothetical protein [Candidatus Poribacteria bacterium]MYG08402.1 hypothetical protein [Candidatus Poribacteria bacterium]MYK22542.1 hypothetical protein [Candidatus Poribacteria bacterium]
MTRRENRLNFRYQLTCSIGLLLLTGALLAGCAATPQPSIDVYMEPIAGRFNAQISAETGAATVIKNGVAVTIKPLDEVELFTLTEDPKMNPYLIVERNGTVEPIYTVFEITVHNREHRRVLVGDTAVLMDANGAQYANLPNDYFDSLYDNVNIGQGDPGRAAYHPYAATVYPAHYGYYQSYVDAEALDWGRIVIEDSIFESGKLFSGAKRSGFLIFDRLESYATDLRIVVPGVRIIRSNGKEDKLEFKVDFRQILP